MKLDIYDDYKDLYFKYSNLYYKLRGVTELRLIGNINFIIIFAR